MNDASPASSPSSHEARLDRLAQVAVKVGVRIARGQELVMTAPLEAAQLARLITEHGLPGWCVPRHHAVLR
jgi:aminopeptidase